MRIWGYEAQSLGCVIVKGLKVLYNKATPCKVLIKRQFKKKTLHAITPFPIHHAKKCDDVGKSVKLLFWQFFLCPQAPFCKGVKLQEPFQR